MSQQAENHRLRREFEEWFAKEPAYVRSLPITPGEAYNIWLGGYELALQSVLEQIREKNAKLAEQVKAYEL